MRESPETCSWAHKAFDGEGSFGRPSSGSGHGSGRTRTVAPTSCRDEAWLPGNQAGSASAEYPFCCWHWNLKWNLNFSEFRETAQRTSIAQFVSF